MHWPTAITDRDVPVLADGPDGFPAQLATLVDAAAGSDAAVAAPAAHAGTDIDAQWLATGFGPFRVEGYQASGARPWRHRLEL
ncbi:MAG: hypothetical protein S0880_19280 [Actinomycetota bacterium]|nr:hypothetical protein [Actinomycetota bacterium]